MPTFVVEVEDLVKTFDSFIAVDHIRFQVEKGEIFGFLGPNGAGKSTTIRMLCGLLLPTSGKGKVAGFDIHRSRLALSRGFKVAPLFEYWAGSDVERECPPTAA